MNSKILVPILLILCAGSSAYASNNLRTSSNEVQETQVHYYGRQLTPASQLGLNCTQGDEKASFVAVMVLAAIPGVSNLGIQEALLEQWTLFAIRWSISVAMCLFACITAVCAAKAPNTNDADAGTMAAGCCTGCLSCLVVLYLCVIYIVEIVMIANGDLGPANGCGYSD